MGNRGGRLHRADQTLTSSRWKSRAWICCLTEFRARRRDVMGAGYTELFFLDEATALTAGHRPCFECRRTAARAFAYAWGRAAGTDPPRAPAMDLVLHCERLGTRIMLDLARMPPGAIFEGEEGYFLRTAEGARLWSFAGYGPERTVAPKVYRCLTPPAILAALLAGYSPVLHPSAIS